MEIREFTKSGAFVAMIFALVVVLVPFGLEQIGDATGLFKFPLTKTVTGWFSFGRVVTPRVRTLAPINWERYRQDLETFTRWVEGQTVADIFLQPIEEEIPVEEEDVKPERQIWSVPVVSCTAGDAVGRAAPARRRKGYVFIAGFDHPYEEGAMIAPSEELCGYEIVCIGERSVWFRAVFESEGDSPMGIFTFPEFTRVEGDRLMKGNRAYVARDAFPLESGGWLMIDAFLPPSAVVFKILDENRRVVATILCVVIGEKGGK